VPHNDPHPLIALFAEFDGRPWSGVSVFNRGAGATVLGPFTAGTTQGIYGDLVDLVNGRGSEAGRSIQALAVSEWTGAGTFTITLTADDRLHFQSSVETFEILGGAGASMLGIASTGTGVIAAGAPGYTAPNEWTRGNFPNLPVSVFPGVGIPFLLFPDANFYQSIAIMLRELGIVADADDSHATDNIQTLDNTANDPVARSIQWGLTDAGYVYWSAPALAGIAAPTWTDTAFRDALGFSGAEVIDTATYPGLSFMAADHRPRAYALHPTRPVERQTRTVAHMATAARRMDGAWSSNLAGHFPGWAVEFYLDGPADSRDLHRGYLEAFLETVRHGARVTLYQDLGETRRALPPPNAGDYSELYTPELNGYRGRLLLRLDPSSGSNYDARWPSDLRRRKLVTLNFTDDERGQ